MRKRLIALLCVATMVLTNVAPTYAADIADVTLVSTEENPEVPEVFQTPNVELSKTSFPYNGIEQTPVITAYDEDGNLVSDEYYTVTYPETSIDAGEYTVEVVFSEPYSGTVTADYEITPIKFLNADFSIPAETYLYTGEAIEPVVSSERYVKDVDYTVAYEDNVLYGTATVTITGIGNYTDTTTLTFDIDLFYYDVLADNTIGVTEVSKNVTGAMEIPSRYDGYLVTTIADEVFKSCKKLTSITTPDTLKNIGENVFYGCTGLTSVKLNGTGVSLGSRAFYNCRALQTLTAKDLQSIGEYCFEGCNKLETVKVEDCIDNIGNYAFNRCLALKTVDIGTSVRTIGANAFYQCSELLSIGRLGNVEYVGTDAFYECKKLASIDLGFSHIVWMNGNIFYGCESLKEVCLPSTLKSIASSTFSGCESLETIELPNNLTNIEWEAFKDCTSLTAIVLPNSVIDVSNNAFKGCIKLETIRLSEGLTSIAWGAFSECTSLKDVVIPEYVRTIEGLAFQGCTSLTSITFPENLGEIESSAFSGCTSLKSIELPDYLGTIGEWAFSGCTSLKSIELPDYLSTIREYAFWECTSLESIKLPACLDAIGEYAFYGCSSLKSIEIPEYVRSIERSTFEACSSLTTVILPDQLETIGSYAFRQSAIKTLRIPASVETIATNACGCNWDDVWIEEVYFPATTPSENIAVDAFVKEGTVLYCYKDTSMHKYALNNGYAYVLIDGTDEDNLISGTDGQYVDWQLDKLTGKLTINTSGDMPEKYYPWKDYRLYVTNVEITGNTTTISDEAFEGFKRLESVKLPDTVATIGASAFSLCKNIESITLPESVVTIKSSAFNHCKHLTNIKLPEHLEVIEGGVFWFCNDLKEIKIPYMVSSLESDTFYGNLEKIIITNKNLLFANDAIKSNKNLKIYGHADSTAKGFAENNNYTFVNLEEHEHNWIETVRVTGDNKGKSITTCCLCGEVKLKSISDTDVWLEYETVTFSFGNELRPAVLSDSLEKNVDFTVSYSNNVNLGTATVTITGIGLYTGTVIKTFNIKPIDISDQYAYFSEYTYVYDGTEKTPTVTIAGLEENIDFTVGYIDNINVGTATVTITGKGNYAGIITKTFTIEAADLPYKSVNLSSKTYTYDGIAKTPTVTIDGLEEDTDFTVVEYTDNISAGTATVTITGKGNYAGTITKTFTIEAADLSNKSANLSSEIYTYDGTEKTPTVTIDGLEEGTDFTVEYTDNIDAGTATVTITGKGNYKGSISKTFTIEPAETLGISAGFHGNGGVFTVKHRDDATTTDEYMTTVEVGGTMAGEDCTFVDDPLISENPDRAFLGWLPCTMTKDYKEDGSFEYIRTPVKEAVVLTTQEMLNYIIPECEAFVFLAQWECEEHDFNEWARNTPATTTSSGERTRKCTVCGKIERKEIAQISSSVTLSKTSYTYTGSVLEPTVTVQDVTGKKLILNTDYTVKYSSNVNAGTANISITFKGDYAGKTIQTTFKIEPVAASKLTAALSKTTYTYNGKPQTPSVSVKHGSKKTLVKDKDYTVKYASGRKNVGKYSVKITYKGNYSGTKTLYYKINPKTTSIKRLTSASKEFSVKWSVVSTQTTGYQIRYSKSSAMSGAKIVTVRANKTTSIKVKNLSAKKTYYVQIRTYKTVNGVNYYSEWSSKKSVKTQ